MEVKCLWESLRNEYCRKFPGSQLPSPMTGQQQAPAKLREQAQDHCQPEAGKPLLTSDPSRSQGETSRSGSTSGTLFPGQEVRTDPSLNPSPRLQAAGRRLGARARRRESSSRAARAGERRDVGEEHPSRHHLREASGDPERKLGRRGKNTNSKFRRNPRGVPKETRAEAAGAQGPSPCTGRVGLEFSCVWGRTSGRFQIQTSLNDISVHIFQLLYNTHTRRQEGKWGLKQRGSKTWMSYQVLLLSQPRHSQQYIHPSHPRWAGGTACAGHASWINACVRLFQGSEASVSPISSPADKISSSVWFWRHPFPFKHFVTTDGILVVTHSPTHYTEKLSNGPLRLCLRLRKDSRVVKGPGTKIGWEWNKYFKVISKRIATSEDKINSTKHITFFSLTNNVLKCRCGRPRTLATV